MPDKELVQNKSLRAIVVARGGVPDRRQFDRFVRRGGWTTRMELRDGGIAVGHTHRQQLQSTL